MKTLTDEQYREYQLLKSQANFDSVRSLNMLENDIDEPVKPIVAMLALLDCGPLFSCCGFDYDGQPLHKTHEYGSVYFMLRNTINSVSLLRHLSSVEIARSLSDDVSVDWMWWMSKNNVFILRSAFTAEHDKVNYPWTRRTSCIHYSEIATVQIRLMEKALYNLQEYFADEVVLKDTNAQYTDMHWQYPALKPWMINKENFLSAFHT